MKAESDELVESLAELAEKCPNGVSCLKTGKCGDRKLCKVVRRTGNDILFIEGDLSFSCPYLLPFGYGHLCVCPVHARLHRNGRAGNFSG